MLISNLANQVQPILRYDLGDSVVLKPSPCPCGNPLPAIRVQGRSSEVLYFETADGARIALPPLVFGSLLDRVPGIDLFQIVQTSPTRLRVRLRAAPGADPEFVWRTSLGAIKEVLSKHRLGAVTAERAEESPEQTSGGKFREVIPLQYSGRS